MGLETIEMPDQEHAFASPATELPADTESVASTQSADGANVFAGIGREIRRIRKRRQMTLEEVAIAADITTGYLSQIERGLAGPTIMALKRIADTLRVSIADFFVDEESVTPYGLVRREERPELRHPISGHAFQQLTHTYLGRMNAAYYTLQPGERTERMSHPGEEFAFVIHGEIEYRVGRNAYRMREGDSLYFDCIETHCVVNLGTERAEWIWISAS